mgnify:FL=1
MKYLDSIRRDNQKIEWLELNNIKLVEILENEVEDLSKKFFYDKFEIDL